MKKLPVMILLFTVTVSVIPINAAVAANLVVRDYTIRENAPVTVEANNLIAGSDYLLNWTTNDAGKTFTAPASGTDSFQLKITGNSTLSTITIYLRNATGELLDSRTLPFITSGSEGIDDLFNNVPIIFLFLFVGAALFGLPLHILRRGR